LQPGICSFTASSSTAPFLRCSKLNGTYGNLHKAHQQCVHTQAMPSQVQTKKRPYQTAHSNVPPVRMSSRTSRLPHSFNATYVCRLHPAMLAAGTACCVRDSQQDT
jgi:hypothetical protein